MSVQVCNKCTKSNSGEASYCYDCGALLAGHTGAGAAAHPGRQPFPSAFVFPSGQACQNFDQLATTCQNNWSAAVEFLRKGFFSSFFGGLGRADLASAAQEAANFPDIDRGLDQLLAKLPTDVLKPPILNVEPTVINLGQIPQGTDRAIQVELHNQGMRLLYGSVASDCKWLLLGEPPGTSQRLFQFGSDTIIPVQVRGKQLRAGNKPNEGQLVVESNGGAATVIVRVQVPVTPFTDGVLAGAKSPREIAEKARAAPQQAAPLFESGAVGDWFSKNGWTYPVQGPAASGLGAVQQFFEALGLAKAPKVEVKTASLNLKGLAGQRLESKIEVSTSERRPIYAYANADEPWLDVSKTKLNGRFATISVVVSSVPNSPGQVLQTRIRVTGNGNQRFDVPLSLVVEGVAAASPRGLARSTPVDDDDAVSTRRPGSVPNLTIPPPPPPPPPPMREAVVAADSGSPFSDISAPSRFQVGGGDGDFPTDTASAGEGVVAKVKTARAGLPFWVHLLPLVILAIAVIGVMVRDLLLTTRVLGESVDTSTPLLKISFDNPKAGRISRFTFGLQMQDPEDAKNWVKLMWENVGQTNTTMLRIVKKGKGKDVTEDLVLGKDKGQWDSRAYEELEHGGLKTAWTNGSIYVTQIVKLLPGNPVETETGDTKRFLDNCLVLYKIENRLAEPQVVGLRFLLDTYLGDTDGPTFAIPGQNKLIDTQYDFDKPESVPDFVQALAKPDVKNPGIVAQVGFKFGSFTDAKVEPPSRVSLTGHPGTPFEKPPNLYDYDVPLEPIWPDEKKEARADSAVVLYWPEKELKKGDTRVVGFTYGIGKLASKSGVGFTVDGNKTPGGELSVVALVDDAQPNQTLKLVLPPELSLVTGADTQAVPSSTKGQPSPVTWKVKSSIEGLFPIRLESSDGVREKRWVKIQQSKLF